MQRTNRGTKVIGNTKDRAAEPLDLLCFVFGQLTRACGRVGPGRLKGSQGIEQLDRWGERHMSRRRLTR